MAKKITIENLAEMTQKGFHDLEERLVTKELFKEGFEVLLSEIRGVREDIASARLSTRIGHGDLQGRVKKLEREVEVLKGNR